VKEGVYEAFLGEFIENLHTSLLHRPLSSYAQHLMAFTLLARAITIVQMAAKPEKRMADDNNS
jgi:hypothetical protein